MLSLFIRVFGVLNLLNHSINKKYFHDLLNHRILDLILFSSVLHLKKRKISAKKEKIKKKQRENQKSEKKKVRKKRKKEQKNRNPIQS